MKKYLKIAGSTVGLLALAAGVGAGINWAKPEAPSAALVSSSFSKKVGVNRPGCAWCVAVASSSVTTGYPSWSQAKALYGYGCTAYACGIDPSPAAEKAVPQYVRANTSEVEAYVDGLYINCCTWLATFNPSAFHKFGSTFYVGEQNPDASGKIALTNQSSGAIDIYENVPGVGYVLLANGVKQGKTVVIPIQVQYQISAGTGLSSRLSVRGFGASLKIGKAVANPLEYPNYGSGSARIQIAVAGKSNLGSLHGEKMLGQPGVRTAPQWVKEAK